MGNAITSKFDIPENHCAEAGLGWKIYHGRTKEEKPKDISVWICSKDALGKLEPAPDCTTCDSLFQVMLRDCDIMKNMADNPHIVKPLECLHDKGRILCFVTERVICSLADMLKGFQHIPGGLGESLNVHFDVDNPAGVPSLSEAEISRGIYNIAEGIQFLHHIQRRMHLDVTTV